MPKFIMVEPREPHLRLEPSPPKEYIEDHHNISFPKKTMTLPELISELPAGVTLDDIRFTTREWDNGCDCGSYNVMYYVTRKPNTRYLSEYKEYENSLEKFKQEKIKWEEEIERFKSDVKEYLAWAKKENQWIDEYKYKEIKKKYFK